MKDQLADGGGSGIDPVDDAVVLVAEVVVDVQEREIGEVFIEPGAVDTGAFQDEDRFESLGEPSRMVSMSSECCTRLNSSVRGGTPPSRN